MWNLRGENKGQVVDSTGIFVGVGKFDDDALPEIPFAVDDAVDLAYVFSVETGLLIPKRVVLAVSGEPKKDSSVRKLRELCQAGALVESAALTSVQRLVFEQAQNSGPRGLFIVSFASHGFLDQGSAILATKDMWATRPVQTGLALQVVLDDVSSSKAPRRIALIDACRESRDAQRRAVFTHHDLDRRFTQEIAKYRGMAVLLGTSRGGFTYDDIEAKNGVFSAAIVEGLRGEAAGANSIVTLGGLAEYADRRVCAWVRRKRPLHVEKCGGVSPHFDPLSIRELPLFLRPDSTAVERLSNPPQPRTKPGWASAFGSDGWGVWAELMVKGVTQRFRWVQAGPCWKGSRFEAGRSEEEEPLHRTVLVNPVWMADTPCTQAFWLAVMGKGQGAHFAFRGGSFPVESTSYRHVENFLSRLAKFTDCDLFALPTETEWECACRAGTDSEVYSSDWKSGMLPVDGIAYYEGNSSARTHQVGQKQPNSLGLYDMLGNVWELVEAANASVGDVWAKGGSWADDRTKIRAGARLRCTWHLESARVGFRIAIRCEGC